MPQRARGLTTTTQRGSALLAAAIAATFGTAATAQTIGSGLPIGIGQTVTLRENTDYLATSPLTLEGGVLNIRNTINSTGVTVNATDSLLRNGIIANNGPQFPNTINFFGITIVGGATTLGPFPANYMYFSAPTESSWTVSNNSIFVVASSLVLMGNTSLRNVAGAGTLTSPRTSFFITNDSSILGDPDKSGIPGSVYPTPLRETGGFVSALTAGIINETNASLTKSGGTGTSEIRVPVIQNAGTVQVTSGGELALTNGGLHNNSIFAGNPLGGLVDGTIRFGGTHIFTGTVTTETGNFVLNEDSLIRVTRSSPVAPVGTWNQNATNFEARGTIDLDGGTLINTGTLNAALVTGRRDANGTHGYLVNQGNFSGNIRAGRVAFEVDRTQLIVVKNEGQFIIAPEQIVESGGFENHNGTLQVDGSLDTYHAPGLNGNVLILGGILSGGGTINGGAFVGGGPGQAMVLPGHSPGTLTINGDFSLLPNGVLELEVESTPGGIAFDRLAVSGAILLNGHVNILVGAGVQQSDMAGLNFFDCGGPCSITYGSNFTWDLPGRPGSQLSFSSTGLEVTTLAPVPEPESYAFMLAGLGLVGWMARRRTKLQGERAKRLTPRVRIPA